MGSSVVIVDYGMGNLHSVSQAVRAAAQGTAFTVSISAEPAAIRAASRVVLPGQGAMPDCMHELQTAAGGALLASVLEAAKNKPLFGVCVGMQMLLQTSSERAPGAAADTPALGLFAGSVEKFDLKAKTQADGSRFKVPQMGWNGVKKTSQGESGLPHPIWAGVPSGAYFYFVHSFYAKPARPQDVAATTDYGGDFACAIAKDNMFATQFHPEKSAVHGLQLYRNFLNWKV